MKKSLGALVVMLAAGLALVSGATAGATASLTITTPRAGQSFSLHRNPYIPVAGGVAFAPANPASTTLFLRRDGCGTSNDNPHLSVTKGTDAGDGCGLVLSSFVGLGGTVDQSAFVDYPSADGMPLTFDASRSISGTIDLENFGLVSGTSAGAGLLTVDISMEALVNGNGVPMGSSSQNVLITPVPANDAVQFTIQPNAALDKTDLQGIDLRVHVQGPFVFSGFIGNSGKSWTTVPSYSASLNRAVQISVDDPTFSHPIPARIGSSGTIWSVAIQTPGVGRHTIYAESIQGFMTSVVVSRGFSVTR